MRYVSKLVVRQRFAPLRCVCALGLLAAAMGCKPPAKAEQQAVDVKVVGINEVASLPVTGAPFDLWTLCQPQIKGLSARSAHNDSMADCDQREVYAYTLAVGGPGQGVFAKLVRRSSGEVVAQTDNVVGVWAAAAQAPTTTDAATAPAATLEVMLGDVALEAIAPNVVSTWASARHPSLGVPLVRLLEHYKIPLHTVARLELYGSGDKPFEVAPALLQAEAETWMAVRLNRHGTLRFVLAKNGQAIEKFKDIRRVVIVPRAKP